MTLATGAALHLRAGTTSHDGWDVVVTPESAGWSFCGLSIVTLPAGGERRLVTTGVETIVVPLQGAASVQVDGHRVELTGRVGVFAGASDIAYVPPGTQTILGTALGGRFALCTARTHDTSHPVQRVAASDVPVEARGAAQASRLVRNFGTIDAMDAAAVIACEVITPAGNWSSYPAHKHDEAGEHEAELEEIYYFEIAAGLHAEPGFGFHRTSSSPGHNIDVLVEVRDGDVVLVPFGWHGPCTAAPGHDMYYLNVMAGPDPSRRWLITDHPGQAWVRETWTDDSVDPRLRDGRFGA